MEAAKTLHRDRIEASLALLERVLTGAVTSRSALVAELQQLYHKKGLEPFRGMSREGIYDKEIATVYLVGIYGAGVIAPGDYDDVFYIENKAVEAIEVVKSVTEILTPDAKAVLERKVTEVKGKSTEDKVFRVLRLVFTGAVFGYYPEMFLVKTIRTFETAYPALAERLINYAAFYSAYKIAEDIALGRIKSPEELKIQKYTYCLKMGFQKCKPSDKLIAEVAAHIYKVARATLTRLLARGALPKLG